MIKFADYDLYLPNPKQNANWLSVLTFWYTLRTFRKGSKRDLDESDLTQPLNVHKSSLLGTRIAKIWAKELAKSKKNNSKPSMVKTILKTFLGDIIFYGVVLLLMEMGARLSQPVFIGLFIKYFNILNLNSTVPASSPMYVNRVFAYIAHQPMSNPIQKSEAYFFAFCILVCSTIIVFVVHPYMMAVLHIGMQIRVACCSLIYRKALRITLSAVGDNSAGNPVNLMSNDVTRFDLAPIYVHYLWIAPLQIVFIVFFLYEDIGISAVVGVSAVLLIMPTQAVLGVLTSTYRRKVAIRTDTRVTEMNELIQGMQVIKMYSWEYAFAYIIQQLRKKELKVMRFTSYIRGLIMSFIMFTARFAIFLTVTCYILLGNDLTAEQVFVISAFYQVLRQTMTVYFPQGIALVGESYVSIKRIEEFMLLDEAVVGNPALLNPQLLDNKAPVVDEKPKLLADQDGEAEFKNEPLLEGESADVYIHQAIATFKNSVVLSNIYVEVSPGQLTIVVGPVGSGKSCFLQLILGELEILKGSVIIKGVVSYASQEPWLFAGSVRQNILFGRPYDRIRYNEVVKVCALQRDFSLLPYGDRTLIGERGISLSGGQRARVNLARAVYKKADIYLLDDPLSAVDIQVGQQLFRECIQTYLQDKIVILVTHQLQYLNDAKQILIFHDGVIQGQGTFDSLKISGIEFAKLMTSDLAPLEEQASFEVDRRGRMKTVNVETILKRLSIGSALSMSTLNREGSMKVPQAVPEMRTFGAVEFTIYKQYFLAAGPYCLTILLIAFFLTAQALGSGGDYFLCQWVALEENKFGEVKSMGFWDYLTRPQCILIYSVVIVLTIVVAISRSIFFFTMCLRSSMNLHNDMFKSITHAVMRFYNDNTSGRILNRFSKDLGAVDELLPNAMIDTTQLMLNLLGAIIVVAIIDPLFLIPTLIMCTSFWFIRKYYLKTSRSVKRLEGITRSPVFAHLNATLQGLSTIRSNGAEQILVAEFDGLQDIHSSAWFMFLYTSRAFSFWLDLICTLYIGTVTFSFLFLASRGHSGSEVGLAVTQCMGLSGLIQWGMRQSAEMENQMTSVERILEFTRIEHEPDLESDPDRKPPFDWPWDGKVEFVDLVLRYHLHQEPVLKNLNFIINPQEKVGIVGRTGAGKSSLISALFRLTNFEGTIVIDTLDIKTMGLHDLRKKISIIPQEPVLFSGTLRYNLDPFEQYSDETLFNALQDVEITFALKDGIECLNHIMTEGGANLSVGQRQMVCLARAILRNNRILVMDEATANVDPQTDQFIQKTIRTKFVHCTVLTIAHRLHTIMDSDRVLVMDAGVAVEFDHPHLLLQDKYGFFYNMVEKTGTTTAEKLKNIAKTNYEEKLKHLSSNLSNDP